MRAILCKTISYMLIGSFLKLDRSPPQYLVQTVAKSLVTTEKRMIRGKISSPYFLYTNTSNLQNKTNSCVISWSKCSDTNKSCWAVSSFHIRSPFGLVRLARPKSSSLLRSFSLTKLLPSAQGYLYSHYIVHRCCHTLSRLMKVPAKLKRPVARSRGPFIADFSCFFTVRSFQKADFSRTNDTVGSSVMSICV